MYNMLLVSTDPGFLVLSQKFRSNYKMSGVEGI